MIQLRCVGVSRISVCGMPASRVHFSAERLAFVLLGAFTRLRMSFGGPAHKPDAEQQQQAATQPYTEHEISFGCSCVFLRGLRGRRMSFKCSCVLCKEALGLKGIGNPVPQTLE